MPKSDEGHPEGAARGTKYLVRSGSDVLCHCDCEDAPVSFPPQADCPWCGCGWMFTCLKCRKAFLFARCVPRRETLEELAAIDSVAFGCKSEDKDEFVASWLDYMKPATPDQDIFAFAECFKVTKNIAFVRGVAYHNDRHDPIATCAAAFMLGTKSQRGASSTTGGAR